MDKAEQLRNTLATNHLVLVEFYTNQSPRYDWLESVAERYGKQVSKRIEVVKVNIEIDKLLSDSYNVYSAPTFLLLLRGKELWRQVGRLTVNELQEMLDEF